MLSQLISLRNSLQPHSTSNNDAVQFNYLFWTDLEKTAKKERAKALTTVQKASKHPEKAGIILRGAMFETELTQSEPRRTFDKEVFIDLIVEKYGETIPKHELRELATKAVVEGNRSNTFTTRRKDDE